jgi:hypothetical protein
LNFSTADKVLSVISTMKNVEEQRSPNRALLNEFFNGDPPWTEKEAEENGILVNFNDKQGANLLHQSRNQLQQAFTKTGSFMKISVDAPADKQELYGNIITNRINRIMNRDRSYYYIMDSVWGGVVLHGISARLWRDPDDWKPGYVGIQDMLIPTDTDISMDSNLRFLAIRVGMRPGELFRRTLAKGKNIAGGWRKESVTKILDTYKELNVNPKNWDWSSNPEQMTELYKQNQSYYDGDAAPMIWFWDFYHREEEYDDPNRNGWYRKMLLDADVISGNLNDETTKFVFRSPRPIAEKLDNFIHFQCGDGNNVPPFKVHSIRSLAWLIYDLVWIMNRLNCQFTQHVFEQLMLLFRVQDPNDRDRLSKLVLQGIVGLIPEGLNMVTADERYQVDNSLVQGLMANLKQRVAESSSQYTQQLDNGTQKERTKYETQAVLSQISALMSTMLGRAYKQEGFAANEIARRFAKPNSQNFDVKKFRRYCLDEGIEPKYLDSERWDVEVEQVLGNGNRALELAESSELMEKVNLFPPSSQAEIKQKWVLAVTNNPKLSARLAPLNKSTVASDAVSFAQQSWGSLMAGGEVDPKEGLSHIEQAEAMLKMMAKHVQEIKQSGGVGTPQDLRGLQEVAKYIAKNISLIAQDQNEKARVKSYADTLSKIMNDVRAFAQRQAEAAQKNKSQMDPEVMAKIQADMAETQAKLKMLEAKTSQQLRHKELKFRQQMQQSAVKAQTGIAVTTGKALADVHAQGMREASKPKMESLE